MSVSVTLTKRGETFKIQRQRFFKTPIKKELLNRSFKETLTLYFKRYFKTKCKRNFLNAIKRQFKNRNVKSVLKTEI